MSYSHSRIFLLESICGDTHTVRKYLSQSDWPAQNRENYIKPRDCNYQAGHFSCVPYAATLHPGTPSQWNLFVSMSPWTIHFTGVRQVPSQALEGVPLPASKKPLKSKNLEYTTQLLRKLQSLLHNWVLESQGKNKVWCPEIVKPNIRFQHQFP